MRLDARFCMSYNHTVIFDRFYANHIFHRPSISLLICTDSLLSISRIISLFFSFKSWGVTFVFYSLWLSMWYIFYPHILCSSLLFSTRPNSRCRLSSNCIFLGFLLVLLAFGLKFLQTSFPRPFIFCCSDWSCHIWWSSLFIFTHCGFTFFKLFSWCCLILWSSLFILSNC